jgi:hypothetical protein
MPSRADAEFVTAKVAATMVAAITVNRFMSSSLAHAMARGFR